MNSHQPEKELGEPGGVSPRSEIRSEPPNSDVPSGTHDNRPPIHRWDYETPIFPAPSGNAVKDFHKAFPTVLLPLPHIRLCLRSGLHCGGEGRGEGARASRVAPSPQPSPPQHAHNKGHVDRGGEGAGIVSSDGWMLFLINPSRRVQSGATEIRVGDSRLDIGNHVFCRPCGTSKNNSTLHPTVETVGYHRAVPTGTKHRVVNLFAALLCLLTLLTPAMADDPSPDPLVEPPLTETDRDYRAYQPVVRPAVPVLENDDWSRNPIDKFILAKLREKQLAPVESADPETLRRRVTFDLTGLPPTPEESVAFRSAKGRPIAERKATHEQQLERLLASPAYGERWAQHWLDLVRFAETDGFEHDLVRPEAWRYRDWVIRAFNDNLPYDRFLELQLAGDELDPGHKESLIATGYLLAGPDMPDLNSQEERRHIYLNAMTTNVGEVFLGLTIGCAQCHHHKVDPLSQHDFYRLRSFFETIDLFPEEPKSEANDPDAKTDPTETKKLPQERIVWNRSGKTPVSHLWIRGDHQRPGPKVGPEVPRVLGRTGIPARPSPSEDDAGNGVERRTALARWLTDRRNPLTARVIVNRVWQHHFGAGLHPTASDFGWMGDDTTHPELLDWLAAEFMESGWDLRKLHGLMLTSATYRLASRPATTPSSAWQKLVRDDPTNRWLGRMNRQRLEGEAIRDALLAVSGELNRKSFGPGVRPPLPPAVASTLLKDQWPVTEDITEHTRRSVYLFARRNLRLPLLEAFDKPDTNLSCPRRSRSTIAPQALHLLNSEFVRDRARVFAERVAKHSDDPRERISYAYESALSRRPTEDEVTASQRFLDRHTDPTAAWHDLCHALFNLNEFVYLD